MPKYKLCPRCELNYIPEEEEYCGVCKAELKIGPQLMFAVDDEEENQEKLCPICKRVYIPVASEMCESCKEQSQYGDDKDDIDLDKDEKWRDFLDEDEKDDIINKENSEEFLSLSELEKQEAEELFDDEEEEYSDDEEMMETRDDFDDDFEIIPFKEGDYIDEDDDEEDEEDFDDDDDDI